MESETDDVDSTQITAGADTAGTGDAEVKIALKERVISDPGQVLRMVSYGIGRDPHMVGDPLQFTVTEQRAAAFVDRHIGRARFPAAPDLLGAG